jgi:hypothetical protein
MPQCIVRYVERGHVGDNDVFAELRDMQLSLYGGHDCSAVVHGMYSSIFTFPKNKLGVIR